MYFGPRRVQAVEQHFLDMTEDDKRAAMSETLQVPSGFAEESDSMPESSSTTSPEPPPPTSVGVRFQKSHFRFYKDLAIAPTRPRTPHHHGQGETQALKLVQQDGTMMVAGASSASRSLALASGVGLAAGVVIEGGVLAVDRFYRHKEITWKEAGQRLGVAVVVSTGASMSIAGSRIGLQSLSSAIGPVGATAGLALRHFNIVASLGLLGASAVYEVVRWRSEPHANLSELVRNLGGVGASHSGGFAGAAAGASIGLALLGPIGALAGAIAGGIAGAVTGTAVYTAAMRRFDKSFEHCADRAARLELGLPLDEPLTQQRIKARWRHIARYVHPDKLDKDRRNDLFTRLTQRKDSLIKSCCEPETAPQAEQQQQLLLDSTTEESASQDE